MQGNSIIIVATQCLGKLLIARQKARAEKESNGAESENRDDDEHAGREIRRSAKPVSSDSAGIDGGGDGMSADGVEKSANR